MKRKYYRNSFRRFLGKLLLPELVHDLQSLEQFKSKLEEAEGKCREFFDSRIDAVFVHDAETGAILDVNPAFEEMFGYSKVEAMDLSVGDLSIEDETYNNKRALKHIEEAFNNGPQVFEWKSRNKKGQIFWTEVSLHGSKASNVKHVIASVRDISNKKAADLALKDSEEKYRRLFESAGEAIFIMDEDKFINCNPRTLEMFGCTKEDIIGKPPSAFSPEFQPDGASSKEKSEEYIQKAYDGSTQRFEWLHKKLDGSPFYATVSLKIIFIQEKKFVLALVRDISQVKEANEALRKSEAKYRMIIENSPSVFWITNAEGKTNYISSNVSKIYGFTADEILRSSNEIWLGRIHKDDVGEVISGFQKMFTTGSPFHAQYRIRTKDNTWIWLDDKGVKVNNEEGEQVAYGVFTDITAQKQSEESLRLSEEKFSKIFSMNPLLISLIRLPDGIREDVNSAFEQISGYSRGELLGGQVFDVELYEDTETIRRALQVYRETGELKNYPATMITKSGKKKYLLFSADIIYNSGVEYILTIGNDITEKQEASQKLYQAVMNAEEKERSRIAKDLHDGLGPILSTIKLYIDWLLDPNKKTDENAIIEKIDRTLSEAMVSLKEISNNLSPHILENYGLVAALNAFIQKIQETRKLEILLETNVAGRLNSGIETTVYRIITECMNNTLKYADAKKVQICIREEIDEVQFDFQDDGRGFDVEKAINKSNGMGLSNLKNRMNMIGGKLSITSELNKGTRIHGDVKTTQFF